MDDRDVACRLKHDVAHLVVAVDVACRSFARTSSAVIRARRMFSSSIVDPAMSSRARLSTTALAAKRIRPYATAVCTSRRAPAPTNPSASDDPEMVTAARSEPIATVTEKSKDDILERLRSPMIRT